LTRYEYINENFERIKNDVGLCITPSCVIKHFAIYGRYIYYRKQGYEIMESAIYAGDDFKMTDRSVFTIIKQMEMEI